MRSQISEYILREKIKKEIKKMMFEADIFSDDSQQEDQEKKDSQMDDATKEEYTLDSVIQKLNTIRSGRSFKDKEIMAQMEKYYNDLDDPEKKALNSFLLGLSQIVTAGVSGTKATEPSEPPASVMMIDKTKVKKKEIKPNIIKKGGQSEPSKSLEDTTSPINVKK